LQQARAINTRIRLFFGDKDTGRDWGEENYVVGTVGRSAGPIKVPLLIHNERSTGGGVIITDCIVKIIETCYITRYKHPNYHHAAYLVGPADSGYAEGVYANGELQAQFKRHGQASRWVKFMTGERMSK
jgi:hypothetical protein